MGAPSCPDFILRRPRRRKWEASVPCRGTGVLLTLCQGRPRAPPRRVPQLARPSCRWATSGSPRSTLELANSALPAPLFLLPSPSSHRFALFLVPQAARSPSSSPSESPAPTHAPLCDELVARDRRRPLGSRGGHPAPQVALVVVPAPACGRYVRLRPQEPRPRVPRRVCRGTSPFSPPPPPRRLSPLLPRTDLSSDLPRLQTFLFLFFAFGAAQYVCCRRASPQIATRRAHLASHSPLAGRRTRRRRASRA